MRDTGKCGSDVTGVNCDATNCRFNTTDRKCSADNIKVKMRRPSPRVKPIAKPSHSAAAVIERYKGIFNPLVFFIISGNHPRP